ncbi:MAG: hypothetical protein JNM97_02455 [Rhodoferax sp.]|nr:hypothetical protein [Rhodoferax sp.]
MHRQEALRGHELQQDAFRRTQIHRFADAMVGGPHDDAVVRAKPIPQRQQFGTTVHMDRDMLHGAVGDRPPDTRRVTHPGHRLHFVPRELDKRQVRVRSDPDEAMERAVALAGVQGIEPDQRQPDNLREELDLRLHVPGADRDMVKA